MSAQLLHPGVEASKMLEAALQQMDGIIAGEKDIIVIYLSVFIYIYLYLATYIYLYLSISDYSCLSIFIYICLYLSICIPI